ncbi:TRAP-type C4-dicarboxylate transport system, small permease component [Cyclobacterium lianum]|uniref:TRAP-type C4-dicarboxylate transport system, small permease component n=1 Tax=Cyclobacterium lianum TaxID=388280 RepID=A0A1M7Q1F0_9BACT|nr:TRAP transporter small permease [Cyclobacterium lianum]SHN23894.1 TRAP-type C4-dicarboxylate transport system, small permease component [Cyclobacterium lianum]
MIKTHFPLLDKILGFFLNLSFVMMIAVVVLQVVARYALPWSPNWTEELARFCFIYLVSIGAALAVKDNGYVSVNTLLDRLSPKTKSKMEVFILVLISCLMFTQFAFSLPLMDIVTLQKSPSLHLNMAFMYGAMAIMGFFVGLYSVFELLKKIK